MSAFQILDRERTLINPTADRVRDVAALARARQRARRGLFLVEGPQAVREALAAHARGPLLDAVYVTPACLEQDPSLGEAIAAAAGSPAPTAPGGASRRVFARLAAPEVLAAMAESQTPQGVLAVAHSAAALTGLPGARDWPGLGAVMVRVQDPGNAGTLIRAADAAGAGLAAATAGSVDLLNPKTVRSTAGSLFHLPVAAHQRLPELLEAARSAGAQILAADGRAALDLDELADAAAAQRPGDGADLRRPTVWLFGNEAQGLSEEEKGLADARVAVPLHGRAESLNVGMAATVCLYASARAQRRRTR
ncbi:RNA methyltransferase [Rothia kristinae]|uniref:RNA methyltransferase n=1 Tax=Rothia kristinae TaxID=37923 RepID=A0A199NR53_9MICC|nr:RNA methyltransferase [Rothia kristinae]OAX51402.1 RNA methyltransferase [Rothia kristinae]